MLVGFLRCKITHAATSGILLFVTTLIAIIMANTNANILYNAIIHFPKHTYNTIPSHLTLLLIVNDGLMVIFFLNVSLKIKYELLQGSLNSYARAAFPAIAALGGIIIPIGIYSLVNIGKPALHAGWAIPAATDIAFAFSVLTLLGKRVPTNLKVFLLTLAIIDDVGAIVIIAFFYNDTIRPVALAIATVIIGTIALMNYANIRFLLLYIFMGIMLWGCILFSGIHATLTGIILGGLIPLTLPTSKVSPALKLIHQLQPWVMYIILPLFAFTNSGIYLRDITLEHIPLSLPLGIVAGLVIGKPIGIILFTAIAIKFKLAKMPANIAYSHIAAVAVLCGIGFTMSIFIANLAFEYKSQEILILSKVGILFGSVTAATFGYLFLRKVLP